MPPTSRAVVPVIVVLVAPFLVTPAASPLEKTSVRADGFEPESWNAAGTCTVRYYNNCTGWVWVWSGWSPGERLGTAYHACCNQAVLRLTEHLTFDGVLSGWGFTGTIEVFAADSSECPTGPPIARQAWLPPKPDGWYDWVWNTPVPQDFVVRITWDPATGFTNPNGLATDHPAAGPTGPQSCGACFPSDRVVHSYYWPVGASPCAGTPLNDGVCDVELMNDAVLYCPVHTEQRTWGTIKALYR